MNKKFKTNQELIDYLHRNRNMIPRVKKIMENIDRKIYASKTGYYLEDKPNQIYVHQHTGQIQTISAPHIHAEALTILTKTLNLNNNNGISILDVGCGSGYITACFALLLRLDIHKKNKVVAIDIFNDLVKLTIDNIKEGNPNILPMKYGGHNKNRNMHITCGNGWLGNKKYGKYDIIHVGAMAESIPSFLIDQLKCGHSL